MPEKPDTALTEFEAKKYIAPPEDKKLLDKIHRRVKKAADRRRDREGVWAVCIAFLHNDQWIRYSTRSHGLFIEPNPNDRKRITYNVLRTFHRKAAARMMAQIPAWQPCPHSSDQKDRDTATLAVDVLRGKWRELEMEEILDESCDWGLTVGSGIIEIKWDTAAKDGLGDIYAESVPATELFTDCLPRKIEKATWVARRRLVPLSWVRQHFPAEGEYVEAEKGLKAIGIDEQIYAQVGIPEYVSAMGAADDEQMVTLTEYYEKPTEQNPQGLTVVCTENVKLFKGPLDLGEYPFKMWLDQRRLTGLFAQSRVELALDLQIELNTSLSQLAECKNLATLVYMLNPKSANIAEGSFIERPGVHVKWSGHGPEPKAICFADRVPQELFQHIQICKLGVQEIFAFHDISMGATPKKVESGIAIQLLSEQDAEAQGSTMHSFLNCVKAIGRRVLRLIQEHYLEDRTVSYTNEENRAIYRHFEGADLEGATDVDLNMSTQLSESKTVRLDQVSNLVKIGAIDIKDPADKRLLRKLLDFGQLEDFYEIQNQQEQFTRAEIELLDKGKQLPVLPWENHPVAIEIHKRRMMRLDFALPPDEMQADMTVVAAWEQMRAAHEQHLAEHEGMGNPILHPELNPVLGAAQQVGIAPPGMAPTAPEPKPTAEEPKGTGPGNPSPEQPPREVRAPQGADLHTGRNL